MCCLSYEEYEFAVFNVLLVQNFPHFPNGTYAYLRRLLRTCLFFKACKLGDLSSFC